MSAAARREVRPGRRVWWIRASSDHSAWRWRDLFREYVRGEPCYYAMGSTLSRKCAREARGGDLAVCYMAGEGYREVQALAQITAGDVRDDDGRPAVSLRPALWLDAAVPRAALIAHPALRAAPFFRIRLGTMFPVSPLEWRAVSALLAGGNPSLRRAIARLAGGA